MVFSRKYLFWLFLSFLTVVIDLFVKQRALVWFSQPASFIEGRFVTFGLHKNPGIIFDIPVPPLFLWSLTIVLISFLLVLAWREQKTNPRVSTGALITVIGALGNFIDRVLHGFTTDYLLFFTRSAVNLSDLVIIAGILTLLLTKKATHSGSLPTEKG